MVDYNAVTTGAKEMDDFEEIQFQPPDSDAMNEYTKRKSKSSQRGSKNKFSKKKTNTNITACKLRDLANKRKKSKICSSDGTHSDVNMTADEDLDENSKENNKENIITNTQGTTVPVTTYPSTILSYNIEPRENNFINPSGDYYFKTENDDFVDSNADDGLDVDVIVASTNCVVISQPISQAASANIPSSSSTDVTTSLDNTCQSELGVNQNNNSSIINSVNLVDNNIHEPSETILYNTSQNIVNTTNSVPVVGIPDNLSNPSNEDAQVECSNPLRNIAEPLSAILTDVSVSDKLVETEKTKLNTADVQNSIVTSVYSTKTHSTVSDSFEMFVTSKKPISNNIIPFKTMRSDFLDSSNSHSGNSQLEENSQIECKEVATSTSSEVTGPPELTFHSLFPCESNQIMLANQENQNIFNTQSLSKFDHLTFSFAKQVSSTPLKCDDSASLSCAPEIDLKSTRSNQSSSSSKTIKSEKTPSKKKDNFFNSNSFLSGTPDKSKMLSIQENSLLTGPSHAEQDLTFQDHSIQTNHLISSDESQTTKVLASSLSFAGILSKIPAKSPCKTKISERGLMGPPAQIFEKAIESKHKDITLDGELTFADHSISNVQLATDIKSVQSLGSSQHVPISPSKSSAIVSNSSSDLTFTGKITPLPFENKSPDMPALPIKSVLKRNDDQPKAKSRLDDIASDSSLSLCQKSVDIDFKVMDNKIVDPIEISSDTKTNESLVNRKISPISAGKDNQSTNQTAFGIFGDVSCSNSNSEDAEVEMITNRSVNINITPSSSHNTSTPIDPGASNDARHKLNFDNNSNQENSREAPVNSSVSQDNSKSPSVNTSFSKLKPLAAKRVKKPRKLSRSEIITLAESTSFQEDSCSSFEDNYCFTPAHRREQSLSESSTTKETLGSLPFQKIDVAEYCNTEKVVKQPVPPSPLTVQKVDEESQQSNRSFSGYASSPQTPVFVSNYVEVKTNDGDTPNRSFNVVDSITADLILKSESCPQPDISSMKPDKVEDATKDSGEQNDETNSSSKLIKDKTSLTPKKKVRRKKEDVRKLRLSDIMESNENEEKTSPVKTTDDIKNKVSTKRKRKESPMSPRKKSKANRIRTMSEHLNAAMQENVSTVEKSEDKEEGKETTPRKSKRISNRYSLLLISFLSFAFDLYCFNQSSL